MHGYFHIAGTQIRTSESGEERQGGALEKRDRYSARFPWQPPVTCATVPMVMVCRVRYQQEMIADWDENRQRHWLPFRNEKTERGLCCSASQFIRLVFGQSAVIGWIWNRDIFKSMLSRGDNESTQSHIQPITLQHMSLQMTSETHTFLSWVCNSTLCWWLPIHCQSNLMLISYINNKQFFDLII